MSHPTPQVLADTIDKDGWLTGARRVLSPNCDERPTVTPISLIVVHAISLPPGQFGGRGIEQLFTNSLDPEEHPYYREIRALRVSSHFLVRRDGEVIQFSACSSRAWHAGVSTWQGRERCNDFSIGIELEGCDEQDFEAEQYDVLAKLIAILRRSYPITDIVGHADIAPGRKTDPGPHFEWQRLRDLIAQ